MSKGLVFKGPNDPTIPRRLRQHWTRHGLTVEQGVQEHNDRWRIAAKCDLAETGECEDEDGIIAEDVVEHRLKHISPRIRHLARMIVDLPADEAAALVSLFGEDGQLVTDDIITRL